MGPFVAAPIRNQTVSIGSNARAGVSLWRPGTIWAAVAMPLQSGRAKGWCDPQGASMAGDQLEIRQATDHELPQILELL